MFRIAKSLVCHLARPFGRLVQHQDDETDQSAPAKDEPKGCGDIGPIAYRALVDGQETCLDRELDQDSSLKASLEQSSSDSCHGGRNRGHHGNAGVSSASVSMTPPGLEQTHFVPMKATAEPMADTIIVQK